MKPKITLRIAGVLALLCFSLTLFAQAPKGFTYQAVARDAIGDPMKNEWIVFHFSILDGDENLVWKEEHSIQTNDLGLFSEVICNDDNQKIDGSATTLVDIDWGSSLHSLKVEIIDGVNTIDLGANPLMAVPYALYAINGKEGPQGLEGPQGIQGETGLQGEPGIEGGQGISGPEGPQGIQGETGIQGPQGDQGIQGTQGSQGLQGDPGIQGAQGDPGPQGDKGDKGDPGTGLTNRGDWLSGTTYNPGDYVFSRSFSDPLVNSMWILEDQIAYLSTSEPFADATHWAEFEAPQGPEGPQGPAGSQGVQGIQGLQGIQGVQGIQGDPATDDQSLTLIGTDLSISGGNIVDLGVLQDGVDDADADPMNEIQDLQLTDGELSITNNVSATPIDLGAYNESNVGWSRNGDNVVYVNGNVGVGTVSPEGRLSVQGVSETAEEPLFMVQRKDGYPVFAVYEDGVYAYTDTVDSGKGIKGGFAVGGYKTLNKGIGDEYMRVTADSIRFYINQDPDAKGLKGGFAVGGYKTLNKDAVIGDEFLRVTPDSVRIYIDDDPAAKGLKGGFAVGGYKTLNKGKAEFFNISGQNAAEVIPGENRVVWYPQRNAFMTGNVLVTEVDSVGENSMATGYRSRAMGDYSQALGYQAIARGEYSTAIGKNAIANDSSSFAFGEYARAMNSESYALGKGAIAEGYRSFAFGSAGIDSSGAETGVAHAIGDYSFAVGQGSISSGLGSFSFGLADTASDEYATAIGYKNSASGVGSIATGYNTSASGDYSSAMGFRTKASGDHSAAMGYQTTASDFFSTAMGSVTTASEQSSTAMGSGTTASGRFSTAMGISTTASSSGATAMGGVTTASRPYSTAMGYYTKASGDYSTVMGYKTTSSGESSTAMGSWTIASNVASTAMGSGTDAIGERSTAIGSFSRASGYASTAIGISANARSYSSIVIGRWNDTLNTSSQTSWVDTDPLFIIGRGSVLDRKNAFTVLKNGYVGIGETKFPPTEMLDVEGNTRIDGEIRQGGIDYGGYEIQTGGQIYTNDYLVAMGGIHVGGISNPGTDNLIVDGNVGIGTSTPAEKLHVVGDIRLDSNGDIAFSNDNTRIYQSSTDLFITADDDLDLSPDDDVYIGADGAASWVRFNNGAQRLGLGTTSPTQQLDVAGNSYFRGITSCQYNSTTDGYALWVAGGTSASYSLRVYKGAYADGNGFVSSSDIRKKENIITLVNSLERVMSLRGVTYTWKESNDPEAPEIKGQQIGLIAQEVEEQFPEIVTTDEEGYKGVAYGKVTAVLVEAVKEQQEIIIDQQEQIETLNERLAKLETAMGF